jgi:hypothetical protein
MASELVKPDALTIAGTSVIIKNHAGVVALAQPDLTTLLTMSDTAATFVPPVGIPAGAVGAPGLAFSADLDTGLYRIGANNLGVAIGGAKVLDVDALALQVVGNFEAGAVSAFATTEPVSAATFKVGTAPAGAVTTSGGIFTDGTTVKKIIAAGTVSDVQT